MTQPRVPYVPADFASPAAAGSHADLVAAIRARRGGKLLNLDRMLLHSPPLAVGWNGFLRAVRTELALDARSRELAICAVAVLNGAEYEFAHHAPEYLRAGGTEAQLASLREPTAADAADVFDPAARAVLRLAFQMTRNVAVDDETFDAVRRHFDDRATVELVGVVATYNMVSRFLVALRVGLESPET